MRTLFFTLALSAPALAADPPKPNTLTQQEIADGWLLLFDGESTLGWAADGDVLVKDGELLFSSKTKPGKISRHPLPLPLEIQFDYQSESPFMIEFGPVENPAGFGRGGDANTWLTRRVRYYREGKDIVYSCLDGKDGMATEVGNETRSPAPAGSADRAVRFYSSENTPARARNIKFRTQPGDELFNGKNLAGWTVNAADPKRKASKFEVTDKGELHVTNGPGDLRTEKAFADFVLQFECKTNGDGLNSGVFFRCVPDEYQNGYEVQIQNAFKDGDRTKPADFGTGAIYRRVPARKVIPNDKEWFTVTVMARGSHIATWVNGVPVVDWTDDRKPDPNPRKGLRTAAGHISIQGHDPTTDILFRNIRITELK